MDGLWYRIGEMLKISIQQRPPDRYCLNIDPRFRVESMCNRRQTEGHCYLGMYRNTHLRTRTHATHTSEKIQNHFLFPLKIAFDDTISSSALAAGAVILK